MLKKLLTVVLVLMLVVGVAGIVSAECPEDLEDACTINATVDVDITLDLDFGCWELDDNNVSVICQNDGSWFFGMGGNSVGMVYQDGGHNFSVIGQDGSWNHVGLVHQTTECGGWFSWFGGYNISTIKQGGNGNSVGVVVQVQG